MLYRFHYLLIACGLLFTVGFGVYRFRSWSASGARKDLVAVGLCALGAIGLAFYLAHLLRTRFGRSSEPTSNEGDES